MIDKNSCSLLTMWYSCPSERQSAWNLICSGDCLPLSVFHSIQQVLPLAFKKHISATPATTPNALFIAPLMPFALLLLMANTRPRRSGREFHKFWNALDCNLDSLITGQLGLLGHPTIALPLLLMCVCGCVCVCAYIYIIRFINN